MIRYGIEVLLVIRKIWGDNPRVTQRWYADDAGAGGKFGHILENHRDLQAWGPERGYHPELTKRILIVAPGNVDQAEEFFWGMGIQVVTVNRYLGGL